MKYSHFNDYYKDIRQNLSQLNRTLTIEDQAFCLAKLRECDKAFVRYLSKNPHPKLKSVFFTRHGLCSLSHKNYGFAPNTAIEDSASEALEKAGSIINHLFSNEPTSKYCIAISPLVRTLQTASKIIPDPFPGTIEIKNFLSENSTHPSGKALASMESLEKQSGFMCYASSKIYNEQYFECLTEALIQAKTIIAEKTMTQSLTEDIDLDEALVLTDNQKIDLINSYIKNERNNNGDIDIWFIGHGNNILNYLNTRYLIEAKLDYCETRKAIHYQHITGDTFEFLTPYSLKVNQVTGLFEGLMLPRDLKPIIIHESPTSLLDEHINTQLKEQKVNRDSKTITMFFKTQPPDNYKKTALHLRGILQGINDQPLSDEEIKILKNDSYDEELKRYNIDIAAVNDELKQAYQVLPPKSGIN